MADPTDDLTDDDFAPHPVLDTFDQLVDAAGIDLDAEMMGGYRGTPDGVGYLQEDNCRVSRQAVAELSTHDLTGLIVLLAHWAAIGREARGLRG